MGNKLVKVVSEKQAKAVVDAQKAYTALQNGEPKDYKKWLGALLKTCASYAGTNVETNKTASKGIITQTDGWLQSRLEELERQYPSMNARQQTIYDAMIQEILVQRAQGKRNEKEIYALAMLEMDRAKDYKNIKTDVVDYWDNLDQFMGGRSQINVPYDRIVDGVLIEGRDKPYTKKELELYIQTAKSRGKKIDYSKYHANQHYTNPEVLEANRQWRSKASKIVGYIIVGGVVIYTLGSSLPAAMSYGSYVATYYTGSATAGTYAGAAVGAIGASSIATEAITTVGSIQETVSGKNYTKDSFRSLLQNMNPDITDAQVDEYYRMYEDSGELLAVGYEQMATEARKISLANKETTFNEPGSKDINEYYVDPQQNAFSRNVYTYAAWMDEHLSDNSIVNIWKGGNAYQEYLEEQKEKEFTYNLYYNNGVKWKALRAVYNIGAAANEALNWTMWLLTQPEVKNALYDGQDFYSLIGGGTPGGLSSQGAVALGKIQGIIVPNVSSNNALSIEDMLSRRVHFIAQPGKTDTNAGDSKDDNATKVTSNEIDITPSKNHSTVSKNPGPKGTPNSSVDILDDMGNVATRRWYDSNGNAYRDVDMSNHGNPKTHLEYPHEHTWEWSNGSPKRSK